MSLAYVNIHTHHLDASISQIAIQNIRLSEVNLVREYPHRLFSVGVHPWFYNPEFISSDLQLIAELAILPNVLAVGECGLDRTVGPSLKAQEGIFEAHLRIAELVHKPVIVHCVRAFPELLACTKRLRPKIPLLVHGFNNKVNILEQLVRNQFLISFGHALLQPDSNASRGIGLVPKERLFLETDDRQTPISAIFAAASSRLRIPEEDLKLLINNNFNTYFKHNH
jgi:TatD DNase family protein